MSETRKEVKILEGKTPLGQQSKLQNVMKIQECLKREKRSKFYKERKDNARSTKQIVECYENRRMSETRKEVEILQGKTPLGQQIKMQNVMKMEEWSEDK